MWASRYLGKQFEVKGRGPERFDCWGLLKYVYEHDHPRRIILPGYEEFYTDTDDKDGISAAIFDNRQERWREVTDPQPFDAILLRMLGVPMHVGIVTKPGFMIHCAIGMNTVHEKYTGLRWANKVMGFFRYE